MKMRRFKVTYPKGYVFVMKAKNLRTLERRLGDSLAGQVELQELTRPIRTGRKK